MPTVTLRFASKGGRAQLVVGETPTLVDLEHASGGTLPSDPIAAFHRWDEVRQFAATHAGAGQPFELSELDAPSPWPTQVFGIGLNYRTHAEETGMPIPTSPLTFTKFSSSVCGPAADIPVTGPAIDWEVELVAVIGTGGRDISESNAWDHVAGLCVGQDVSDRALQYATQPPQFSLGKSRRNFSPFGPWLTDARDVAGRDNLTMWCTVNGEEVQRTMTDDLIFGIPHLVSYLSGIVQLLPGDVIYTGTPSGVGASRKPPRFLAAGDVVVSAVEGLGTITNRCVPA